MNDRTRGTFWAWSGIKAWIVGLTSVVVVLPALINGGIDVYKTLWNIPKTPAEEINRTLSERYFNHPPVGVLPVSVKTDLGTVDMKLSIYEGGDIYVEYGTHTRWFPSPLTATASSSLISTAYAQGPAAQSQTGEYTQTDKLVGNTIARTRNYSNGTKETYIIDRNTGAILSKTVSRGTKPHSAESTSPELKVRMLPGLAVDARKQPQ